VTLRHSLWYVETEIRPVEANEVHRFAERSHAVHLLPATPEIWPRSLIELIKCQITGEQNNRLHGSAG
jgi:hypothetical protein